MEFEGQGMCCCWFEVPGRGAMSRYAIQGGICGQGSYATVVNPEGLAPDWFLLGVLCGLLYAVPMHLRLPACLLVLVIRVPLGSLVAIPPKSLLPISLSLHPAETIGLFCA